MSEEKSSCFLCTSITEPSEVPIEYLGNQLMTCGDNPGYWISLCEQCTQLTANARKLHQNFLKIEKELGTIQSDILRRIIENQEEYSCGDDNTIKFLNKIKRFVKNHEYTNLNRITDHQHLEGDQLARNLESQATNSTMLFPLFDESVTHEDIKVEVDLETFSSPSSPISDPLGDTILINSPSGRKPQKRITKTDQKFTCEICESEMSNSYSLYRHRRFVHKIGKGRNVTPRLSSLTSSGWDGNLVCSLCGKEFTNTLDTQRHIKTINQKLVCHLCGMGIQSKHQLNLQLLGKHKDDPVAKQLEEEEGLKNVKCPVVGCPSRFIKMEARNKHVDKFHGGIGEKDLEEIDKRFKCQFCGKGFWESTKLRHHERIHEGEGREDWKCEICGKGFSTKQYLRYHQLHTHKQSKKFQRN